MAAAKGKARYIDCDVEEPNGYLFFKPQEVFSREVTVKIPIVDESMCDGCRICIDFCKFNALALIGNKIRVFEEICHSCGGCLLVCPQKAIREKEKVIGRVEQGLSEGVQVVTGILNIGEASGVPIIDYISNIQWDPMELTFIDCPQAANVL